MARKPQTLDASSSGITITVPVERRGDTFRLVGLRIARVKENGDVVFELDVPGQSTYN